MDSSERSEYIDKLMTSDEKEIIDKRDTNDEKITDVNNHAEPKIIEESIVVEKTNDDKLNIVTKESTEATTSLALKLIVDQPTQVSESDTDQIKKSNEAKPVIKVDEMVIEECLSKHEKPRLRKRANSVSNKSVNEIKTPITRKRTQSFALNQKSIDNLSIETKESFEKSSKSLDSKLKIDEAPDVSKSENMDQISKYVDEESKTTGEEIDTDESPSKDEKPRLRKRANSTSSNRSVDEVKTPITRKRPQSSASNKSTTEETTPETPKELTPSRKTAKTPTSEVRRIITRRISKEMGEKIDDSMSLDDLTPKRRSNRLRSKNVDDNESVTSESSIISNRSKASEDAGDVKIRKGRKSVLPTKPDLSVIPEVIAEEVEAKGEDSAVMADYSNARR